MSSARYDFLSEIVAAHQDKPLLQGPEGDVSYGEFMTHALQLLNFLVSQGLRHGDRVVVSLENRPQYLELVMALALGGMVVCPVDPAVTVAQLNKTKQAVNASLTITSYDQLAYALDKHLPDCAQQGGLDDAFLVVFSSGTTGAPKGIVQSFGHFFRAARQFAAAVGQGEGQLTLHNWPMFYNAGLFNLFACPLMSGGRIAISKRFSARDLGGFWNDVAAHAPDYVYLSPTMMASLAKTLKFFKPDLAAIQHATVISTSSILYPAIKDEFQRLIGAPVRPCFGITELGGSFTIGAADSGPFSVGTVMAPVEVEIDAAADGELLVRTPFMALGYLNAAGGIDYFAREQPFRSGDLGHVDGGQLYILGRKKDAIKKGGELISLTEIEDMVHASGLCEECYAVGRPDLFWGEVYDVFFVAAADGNPAQIRDELIRLFNAALPQAQRPEQVHAVDEIPRTASGKPIKRLISYKGV